MISGVEGLRVAVTGAGRGIGRATAVRLAELGADVAVMDIDLRSFAEVSDEAAEPTTVLVEKLGRRTVGIEADLTDEQACHAAVETVTETFGGLDVMVNIAGGAVTPFDRSAPSTIPTADIRTCLDVNLMSTVQLCQAAVPHLVAAAAEGRPAAIVNMSSISATQILPGGKYSGYALAKAAVSQYTRCLADDLGPQGVRVNAVAPGYVMTERVRANSVATGFADKAADSVLGRLAEPEDIADAIVYLASPSARYVTGQILAVDGALRLR